MSVGAHTNERTSWRTRLSDPMVGAVLQLGGWKTERMMRCYAAVTDETLRRAAEAVSGNEEWQLARKSARVQGRPLPLQG